MSISVAFATEIDIPSAPFPSGEGRGEVLAPLAFLGRGVGGEGGKLADQKIGKIGPLIRQVPRFSWSKWFGCTRAFIRSRRETHPGYPKFGLTRGIQARPAFSFSSISHGVPPLVSVSWFQILVFITAFSPSQNCFELFLSNNSPFHRQPLFALNCFELFQSNNSPFEVY
jgi:hypothetical protein